MNIQRYNEYSVIISVGFTLVFVLMQVTFLELPEETMQEYVKTDEPYDKAGGYGIQSVGGSFVSKYEGDFYNVVGLPLDRLVREIDTFL